MAKLTKRGNSLTVAIHPFKLEAVGFKEGDEINIQVKGKKLILTKESK